MACQLRLDGQLVDVQLLGGELLGAQLRLEWQLVDVQLLGGELLGVQLRLDGQLLGGQLQLDGLSRLLVFGHNVFGSSKSHHWDQKLWTGDTKPDCSRFADKRCIPVRFDRQFGSSIELRLIASKRRGCRQSEH